MNVTPSIWRHLKAAVSILVLAAVAVFFVRAFRGNWMRIQEHDFRVVPGFAVLSFAAFFVTALLATYAWHITLNTLSTNKLTFIESFATTNASSLVKYIPGKVWSYALQMYWLSERQISKSLVLYTNVVNIAISLLTATALGTLLLAFTPAPVSRELLWLAFCLILLLDVVCVTANSWLFSLLQRLAARLTGRSIETFDVPARLMLKLNGIHLGASVAFALAVLWTTNAIGYRLATEESLRVMGAFLLSEVTAFVAFVSPGGLGVRESMMYAMLGGADAGSLAILVPLAARAISMAVDITLGGIALLLLRNLARSIPA